MTNIESTGERTHGEISRRTLTKAGAWAVPAIALAATTPAASASQGKCEPIWGTIEWNTELIGLEDTVAGVNIIQTNGGGEDHLHDPDHRRLGLRRQDRPSAGVRQHRRVQPQERSRRHGQGPPGLVHEPQPGYPSAGAGRVRRADRGHQPRGGQRGERQADDPRGPPDHEQRPRDGQRRGPWRDRGRAAAQSTTRSRSASTAAASTPPTTPGRRRSSRRTSTWATTPRSCRSASTSRSSTPSARPSRW